jgi:small subunit ribosomal protein S20
LANKKSAIKRIRQNARRHVRNNYFNARARTLVKKARLSMETGGSDETRAATLEAISALDKAAQKGVLHPNNASRRKGRLMRRLAQLDK